MSELPKVEVYVYYLIWISGVSISLYHLFLVGQVFDHRHHDQYHYEDFKKGWPILGNRYQDQADYEWNTWTKLFIELTPFLVINLIGAEYLRTWKFWHALPIWYTLVTIGFLILHFNGILTLWFIGQTIIYLILIYYKSHIFIWITSFVIIHFLKPDIWFVKNDDDQYLVMVSSSWMVLRCISYSTDRIYKLESRSKAQGLNVTDIIVLLGYSFYLPTMFCGPFISYSYFDEAIKRKNSKWTYERILNTAKNFIKCIFWYFFTIFALHFIYVNAILLRPDFVKHLLDWELAGLGIAMGHFFHLKYMVFYGIPCSWAFAEGFTTPKLPCCVSRVHLYSYMWRHFDNGLYQFLVRYIYIPIISRMKGRFTMHKIVASIACFTFMFTWHREQDYVFFWVLFNFIAVTIELITKEMCKVPTVYKFLEENISPENQIRLQCLFAAPLHCFSMISNYFFIGNGMEIGFMYLKRVFYSSPTTKLVILFFLYGAGQSAVASQMRENRTEKTTKKQKNKKS